MLDAQLAAEVEVTPSWNINPGQHVPVLFEVPDHNGALHREMYTARWGLLKPWNREEADSYKWRTHNAKQETADSLRTWKGPLASGRCAVPADAYYEWQKITEKNKVPHAIRPRDGAGMLFAGLWEQWTRPADGVKMLTCSILTRDAPPEDSAGTLGDLAKIYHRMPLPLKPATVEEWITPVELEPARSRALLDRVTAEALEIAEQWEVYPVSREVGNAQNDRPELLEPVSPDTLF